MATRILGPTGSKRRKRFLLGPVLLVAALAALFVAGGARAVHDLGLFELDRNATTQTTNDWDHAFNAARDTTGKCTNPTTALGANALACSFVHDATDASIFTGGSSKDDNDINVVSGTTTSPNWLWKDGSVPDKDNLSDAYAALFTNPTSVSCTPPPTPCAPQAGDQILYVGADRFANNGSTDMGFWFFKNPVSVNSSGSFDGVHTVGDLLLLSTFTQGGATTTIRAFVWVGKNGTCPTGTSYATSGNTICGPVATLADCTVASGGDFGCATVNGVAANPGTPSPWPYTSKFPDGTQSASNIFASGTFLEGGIDLTEFGLQGCFSSFLAETRSSPSVTATLKDFVIGSLESCSASMSTTPKNADGTATAPDSDTPGALSIGTGTVKVTDRADLMVNGTGIWSGTLKFFLCGPISTGTCDGTTGHVGLQIGSDMSVSQNSGSPDGSGGRLIDSSQALLTSAANKSTAAPGHYCWRGEFHFTSPALADMSDSTSGECFIVKPVTPSLSTSATCSATPCILGSTLRDTATLTGAATKPGTDGPDTTDPFRSIYQGTATPTLSGTNKNITWTLFAPASDGSASCTNGTKTLSTSSVQANGNGTYPTTSPSPVSYTTTASDGLGIYTFAASYPADSPNNLAAPNVDCSTTTPVITEQVTVTSQATTTTAQKWLPQDTATVTALGGATVAGTVSFSLYESADCSGIAVQTFAPITVDSNGQATTNNQTYYTTTKTISWRATFTSSNNVGSGSPSHCETMSVSTLNNDLGPGS